MHRKAFHSVLTASDFLEWIINSLQPQAYGLASDLKQGAAHQPLQPQRKPLLATEVVFFCLDI